MVHNPNEWNRSKLVYELYRRLPYMQKVIKDVVYGLIALMYELMLDKKAIRLYKVGVLFPRVKRIKRYPGWNGKKEVVADKLRYFFQNSDQFKCDLDEVLRRDNDNPEGGASQ